MNDSTTDKNKLIRFLFLNIAYLLKQSGEKIKYEEPQYGDANLGFAITMFRVNHAAYDYATQCFKLMKKDVVRECGVTMSVSFGTPEENMAFKEHFKSLIDQAEEELAEIGDRTPHEHYFLNCSPVIVGTENGQSNHYVFLRAEIEDDLDREVCKKILGDCNMSDNDGMVDIRVSCYRKKWRDQLVRYLKGIGVEEV